MYDFWICPRGSVGVSHILGLGVCTIVGVTGRHALWDAKSGVDRLFVSLASMYLTIKITLMLSTFKCFTFHLVRAQPPPTPCSWAEDCTGMAKGRKRQHTAKDDAQRRVPRTGQPLTWSGLCFTSHTHTYVKRLASPGKQIQSSGAPGTTGAPNVPLHPGIRQVHPDPLSFLLIVHLWMGSCS